MSLPQSEYLIAANISGDNARREFKSAIVTSMMFGAATILAYEATENFLPDSPFREAAANSILKLGGLVTGLTAAAGSVTAAVMKYDEVRLLRAEIQCREDQI